MRAVEARNQKFFNFSRHGRHLSRYSMVHPMVFYLDFYWMACWFFRGLGLRLLDPIFCVHHCTAQPVRTNFKNCSTATDMCWEHGEYETPVRIGCENLLGKSFWSRRFLQRKQLVIDTVSTIGDSMIGFSFSYFFCQNSSLWRPDSTSRSEYICKVISDHSLCTSSWLSAHHLHFRSWFA